VSASAVAGQRPVDAVVGQPRLLAERVGLQGEAAGIVILVAPGAEVGVAGGQPPAGGIIAIGPGVAGVVGKAGQAVEQVVAIGGDHRAGAELLLAAQGAAEGVDVVGRGAAELVGHRELGDGDAGAQAVGAGDGGVVGELALGAPVDRVVGEGGRVDRAAGIVEPAPAKAGGAVCEARLPRLS